MRELAQALRENLAQALVIARQIGHEDITACLEMSQEDILAWLSTVLPVNPSSTGLGPD